MDRRVYEDVEADVRSTGQAVAVVVLASVAGGIGLLGLGGNASVSRHGNRRVADRLVGLGCADVLIGTHLLPEPQTRANAGKLLRTIAFASALVFARPRSDPGPRPGHLRNRLGVDAAGDDRRRPPALDYRSTARAVVVCVVGWALSLAVAAVIEEYLRTDRVLTRAAVRNFLRGAVLYGRRSRCALCDRCFVRDSCVPHRRRIAPDPLRRQRQGQRLRFASSFTRRLPRWHLPRQQHDGPRHDCVRPWTAAVSG